MKQSRRRSLIEACAHVVLGYALAVALQLVLYPAYGLHPSVAQSMKLALWFSLLSLARSYALRRFFNWLGG
ncbi:DUF7220 family protein [Neogemmobacter tilapiae]|uniref:Uncharacterized protein n=1 Tax=Neogemmobacter tilapiae TaxID=875041 RepID=A0A918TYZ9_9RHOB|nr:hypothetical protein [Gemmobacter tilapiae]GHC67686.1 hypothetical protein GCM10007315_35860 [Gemmobacter tilapiae]